MFARPLSRIAAVSVRKFHCGPSRILTPPLSHVVGMPPAQHLNGVLHGVGCVVEKAAALGAMPQAWNGGCRNFTMARKRGPRKTAKFSRDEIEAQEQMEREANRSYEQIDKSWEYDDPSHFAQHASSNPDEVSSTPILDAYERSKCPTEMGRLIQMSFDVLPERTGPRRNNHKRRQNQKFKTIRNIRWKEKEQRMAAYERKLQKRRDRKAREAALFATWRTPESSNASASPSSASSDANS